MSILLSLDKGENRIKKKRAAEISGSFLSYLFDNYPYLKTRFNNRIGFQKESKCNDRDTHKKPVFIGI